MFILKKQQQQNTFLCRYVVCKWIQTDKYVFFSVRQYIWLIRWILLSTTQDSKCKINQNKILLLPKVKKKIEEEVLESI